MTLWLQWIKRLICCFKLMVLLQNHHQGKVEETAANTTHTQPAQVPVWMQSGWCHRPELCKIEHHRRSTLTASRKQHSRWCVWSRCFCILSISDCIWHSSTGRASKRSLIISVHCVNLVQMSAPLSVHLVRKWSSFEFCRWSDVVDCWILKVHGLTVLYN